MTKLPKHDKDGFNINTPNERNKPKDLRVGYVKDALGSEERCMFPERKICARNERA